jgi:hypothetical protein
MKGVTLTQRFSLLGGGGDRKGMKIQEHVSDPYPVALGKNTTRV